MGYCGGYGYDGLYSDAKKKKPVLIGTGLCALSSLCSYVITRSKLTPFLSKYYEPIQYNGIPIILTVTAVLAYLVLILSLTRPFAARKLFYLPAVIRVLGLAAMVLCWEFDEDTLIISLFFSAEAAALLFVGLWSKKLNARRP